MPDGDYVVPIGKARVARAGKDVSIITYAAMLHVALEAAEAAAAGRHRGRGRWTCARCCRSTRRRSSTTAAKTGKVIVLHEATRTGGPGGEIAALIAERAFEYLDAPVVRLAPPDTPGALLAAARGGLPAERRQGRQGHPGARMITDGLVALQRRGSE